MKKQIAKEVFLKDYVPPAYIVDSVDLAFDIGDKKTRVRSLMQVRRNPAAKDKNAALELNGEELKLLSVKLNGKKLGKKDYELSARWLKIKNAGNIAEVEIENEVEPAKNTLLSGLYAAGDMYCTQCEAEGFRRITYYPDRPDVLAKFRVKITSDKKRHPVLLSNGNLIAKGNEGKSRHWAVWEDPFPKPCYLFALVAGRLDRVADYFVTKSGRKVLLEIYVEPERKSETGIAMASIKKAMKWDEERFGLEYDLDRFMIVAVSFFNMGAMENKGLNIFNDACVLGRPETATDGTISFIERVVGHEYFHNWTGDRVTCRDWFQLSLKEGLTVFREQEFCGDMNAKALERITTVWGLRRSQFAEDAGAMAHPIRPASYQAIDNFYTSTVYQKGSEVVRMIQSFVGEKGFRKGMDLYFKRHDGQAATCENFVSAMADANRFDLRQFMLWYSQAGTPVLDVKGKYDEKRKEFTLSVDQSCPPTPGQPKKLPMHMPLAVGFVGEKGGDLIGTKILEIKKAKERFVIKNLREKPVPSLLREFSAPVRLRYDYADDELFVLMSRDMDEFNRWESTQRLFTKQVFSDEKLPEEFIAALRDVLLDKKMSSAVKAMTLTLPSEAELGLEARARGEFINPVDIYWRRNRVIYEVANSLYHDLKAVFVKIEKSLSETDCDGKARGERSLKNLCVSYLAKADEAKTITVASRMVSRSRNMSDKMTGLSILVETDAKEKAEMLKFFERKYEKVPTIMDNWLSVQASARRKDVLGTVKKLMKHKSFSMKNPNRVSALIGVFAANPLGFHAEDGSGYRFVGDIIAKLDGINAQAAARLAKQFLRWRDFDAKRQGLMKAELKKISKIKGLSANCREIAQKSLSL